MFDINFYMKVHDLKYRVMNGENFSKEFLVEKLEEYRSREPVVYNIETTNACNMRCEMCPRTTMMTRPLETLEKDQFDEIMPSFAPGHLRNGKNGRHLSRKNTVLPRMICLRIIISCMLSRV